MVDLSPGPNPCQTLGSLGHSAVRSLIKIHSGFQGKILPFRTCSFVRRMLLALLQLYAIIITKTSIIKERLYNLVGISEGETDKNDLTSV